jgi:hypothetical protein
VVRLARVVVRVVGVEGVEAEVRVVGVVTSKSSVVSSK